MIIIIIIFFSRESALRLRNSLNKARLFKKTSVQGEYSYFLLQNNNDCEKPNLLDKEFSNIRDWPIDKKQSDNRVTNLEETIHKIHKFQNGTV